MEDDDQPRRKNFKYFLSKTLLFWTVYGTRTLRYHAKDDAFFIKKALRKAPLDRNFVKVNNGILHVDIYTPLEQMISAAYILINSILDLGLPEGYFYHVWGSSVAEPNLRQAIIDYKNKGSLLKNYQTFDILSNVNGVYFTATIGGHGFEYDPREKVRRQDISILYATQARSGRSFTGPFFKEGGNQFIKNVFQPYIEKKAWNPSCRSPNNCLYQTTQSQFIALYTFAVENGFLYVNNKLLAGAFVIDYSEMDCIEEQKYIQSNLLLTCRYEFFFAILVNYLVKTGEFTLNNLITAFFCLWNIEHRLHPSQLEDILFHEDLTCDQVYEIFAKKLQMFYAIYKGFENQGIDLGKVTKVPSTFYVTESFLAKNYGVQFHDLEEDEREYDNLNSVKAYEKNHYWKEPDLQDMQEIQEMRPYDQRKKLQGKDSNPKRTGQTVSTRKGG